MAKPILVFERTEKKYLITKEQYLKLRDKWVNKQIDDDYGLSTICNVYYDNDEYRLVRTSNEKPDYKEKFRLRSYGIPTADSIVFLEIKKKVQGVVYKRRIHMSYKEAMLFLSDSSFKVSDTQKEKEIKYMFQLYDLKPKMFIAYDRIATYNIDDVNLRVTFDFNIRNREENVELINGDYGNCILSDDWILMEIKANQAMPLWMVKDLETLNIKPTSFSKYGNFYKQKVIKERNSLIVSNELKERDIKVCFQV